MIERYRLVFSRNFEQVISSLRRKNPDVVRELASHFPKLSRQPELGKPLRHALRNYRRMHVSGSFVLLYELRDHDVILIDFDHHDRIYKKYS